MHSVLTISDFKAFENQSVTLKTLTVFAGSNSVGKSTIIQALLLSRYVYSEKLKFGEKIIGTRIPLNGPFMLELGNTTEVVRRGKKVSDSQFGFSMEYNGEKIVELTFKADIASQANYEIEISRAVFKNDAHPFLSDTFYYLCAERIGPRLKYEHEVQPYANAGHRGENTFQLLSALNLPTHVGRIFKKQDPPLLFDQVRKWLNYVIPGANFDNAVPLGKSKTIQGTFGESLPPNVGFGISYVLPIIVNGLIATSNSMFIVENPEAHLHPSGQSRIGRFLTQVASSGVNVIVETHSEHVLNGIRIGVLEGDKITPDQLIVNFITTSDSKVPIIEEIKLNGNSEFDEYPPGFVDQEQRDIAEMVRIKKNHHA